MMLAFGGPLKENPALPGFFMPAFRGLPSVDTGWVPAHELVKADSSNSIRSPSNTTPRVVPLFC